jgi:hypothetical protein
MTRSGGIDGPSTVPAGTTEITVTAPDSTHVTVTNMNTGDEQTVSVGPDGKAVIPIPAGTPGGTYLVVSDPNDREKAKEIEIVSSD